MGRRVPGHDARRDLDQPGTDTVSVLLKGRSVPVDHARRMSFGADLVGLPHDFRGRAIFADIGRVDAGPEVAVTDVLGGPPCQKSAEALFSLPFRPVELGAK